jgi:hypothetical protein
MTSPVGGHIVDHRQPLGSISHTRYQMIRQCELKAVFSSRRGARTPSPSSVLGRIAHRVMEDFASRFPTPFLEEVGSDAAGKLCDDAWDKAEAEECRRDDVRRLIEVAGPTKGWRAYHDQKLWLVRVFRLTSSWLQSLRLHDPLLPEYEITSPDGEIYGKLDLLVRGDPGLVLDYKTGPVLEEGKLKTEIRQQLTLYAWLDAQESNRWPRFLGVVPREGPLIDWETTPETREEAASLVEDMGRALAEWNSRLSVAGEPSPSVDNCRFCPFKSECSAFWEVAPSWPDSLPVAELEITGSRQLGAGGVVFSFRPVKATAALDGTRFLRIRNGTSVPLALREGEAAGFPFIAVVDGFTRHGSAIDLRTWSSVTSKS